MTESARQISPTRQKLRDCRARRPSILSSSHCRCCQPRRVPPSLSAKSCDAPLARIGAAVGIPATEGRGVFWQKEAKFLNGPGRRVKRVLPVPPATTAMEATSGTCCSASRHFLAKHSMQNPLWLWHGAFVGHNRPAPDQIAPRFQSGALPQCTNGDGRQCDARTQRQCVDDEIAETCMSVGSKQLGELNCSGENHQCDHDQERSAAIGQTEGKSRRAENCQVLDVMWCAGFGPPRGRNER